MRWTFSPVERGAQARHRAGRLLVCYYKKSHARQSWPPARAPIGCELPTRPPGYRGGRSTYYNTSPLTWHRHHALGHLPGTITKPNLATLIRTSPLRTTLPPTSPSHSPSPMRLCLKPYMIPCTRSSQAGMRAAIVMVWPRTQRNLLSRLLDTSLSIGCKYATNTQVPSGQFVNESEW